MNSAEKKGLELAQLYEHYEPLLRKAVSSGRAKFVRGEGNADAKVIFIGEAPGLNEDLKGRPFIGRAGQLLNQWLESIGLKREHVFITNVVKCHPMKNSGTPQARGNDRPPTPSEIQACWPVLKQEITIIDPDVIVTLGSPSTRAVLQTQEPITKMCGRFFPFPAKADVRVFPLFHPAALFHNPTLQSTVKKDLVVLREALR